MSSYIKTALLFGILTVLLVLIGRAIGGTGGMTLFLIISLVINFASYFFSDKIALSMAHAQAVSEQEAPQLYSIIRELTQKDNIPMPKIYITPDMQPNAFATGRNPKHASVAVTQGILKVLNVDQLKGVLAHEISHVKNRDILIATIAAVLAGVITYVAQLGMFMGGGNNRENSNPISGLLLIIVAPIAATLIQLAISRQREYAADLSGAELTRKPEDLATALETIETNVQRIPMQVNQSISSLYIANPFGGRNLAGLFSTHPSTADRIARLMELEEKLK